MNNELRAKLKTALERRVTSEQDAMYILVETRRLMETSQVGNKYESLKLHCDWVVHSQLTGKYARAIVRLFDQYQENLEQMDRPIARDWSFMQRLGPMIALSGFREELSAYLRSQGLPFTISDNDAQWANFISHYSQIVSECPLRCTSPGLKHTDEVTLGILEIRPETAQTPLRVFVEWKWKSKLTGEDWSEARSY